jgi:hypothetical protein
VAKGEPVSLWHSKESFRRSPGFYLAYGDLALDGARAPLVRLYWNVTPVGAGTLLREVTGRLNRDAVPFVMKVLDDPRNYARCDAAVLYFERVSYEGFRAEHAGHVLHLLAGHMADGVPALTKRVASGLALAENPAQEQSFGSQRCGALARAIVDGLGTHRALLERLDLVEAEFRRSGIDPRLPYLNLGSSDTYRVIDRRPLRRRRVSSAATADTSPLGEQESLGAARGIGAQIVGRAIWHGGQCTWIGALGVGAGSPRATRVGSVGGDLYDGTSGIALFLGELYRATGDDHVGRTALGAIDHAMTHQVEASAERAGFYVGTLGTAVVAARLGHLFGRDDLIDRAWSLATTKRPEDTEFDLISGLAGRVLGNLQLHVLLDDDDLFDAALAMGHRLIASADKSGRGVSWSSEHLPGRRNLTGLSHGVAGAAYALLELFAISGDEDFRVTAEAAMEYERSWFDQRARNWPDFRQVMQQGSAPLTRLPYSTTWCHGAPGIAVSRIRAAEDLSDRIYADEASVALKTTRDHLRGWLDSGHPNYSLCHGVAGIADVLLMGLRSDAMPDFDDGGLIHETARRGIRTFVDTGAFPPSGAGGGGANPSLMLGWAGTGLFYLRLARQGVQSPLAPSAQTLEGPRACHSMP